MIRSRFAVLPAAAITAALLLTGCSTSPEAPTPAPTPTYAGGMPQVIEPTETIELTGATDYLGEDASRQAYAFAASFATLALTDPSLATAHTDGIDKVMAAFGPYLTDKARAELSAALTAWAAGDTNDFETAVYDIAGLTPLLVLPGQHGYPTTPAIQDIAFADGVISGSPQGPDTVLVEFTATGNWHYTETPTDTAEFASAISRPVRLVLVATPDGPTPFLVDGWLPAPLWWEPSTPVSK